MNNNSFRQKVSAKFTLKISPINTDKKDNRDIDKSVSVKRLPLPILAKLPREINKISKYFKMTSYNKADSNKSKLYAQVSKIGSSAKEIFKIEDAFPNFKAGKIYNIQKIIVKNRKLKPRINMTTKSLSRKQVIISISNNNKVKFIEDSCTHVFNLNRALKILSLISWLILFIKKQLV